MYIWSGLICKKHLTVRWNRITNVFNRKHLQWLSLMSSKSVKHRSLRIVRDPEKSFRTRSNLLFVFNLDTLLITLIEATWNYLYILSGPGRTCTGVYSPDWFCDFLKSRIILISARIHQSFKLSLVLTEASFTSSITVCFLCYFQSATDFRFVDFEQEAFSSPLTRNRVFLWNRRKISQITPKHAYNCLKNNLRWQSLCFIMTAFALFAVL